MGAWGKRILGRMHEGNRKIIMEVSRRNDGREQKVGELAQLPPSRFLTLTLSLLCAISSEKLHTPTRQGPKHTGPAQHHALCPRRREALSPSFLPLTHGPTRAPLTHIHIHPSSHPPLPSRPHPSPNTPT